MHFEKVSFEEWCKDIPLKNVDAYMLLRWWNNISLPSQGTEHSMGVDFYTPYEIKILAHNKVKIPTGIRWVCDGEYDHIYGMLIVPRSSVGIKLGLRLLNTVGVIDADYYLADNEGHIMLFMENTTDEDVVLKMGQGLAQGLIIPYIIPETATSESSRHGGFGSTDIT